MLHIEKILVPVDFSDFTHQALAYAADIARRYDAAVCLLHAIDPPVMAMPSIGAPPPPQLLTDQEEEARRELASLARGLGELAPRAETVVVRDLPAREAIVDYAARQNMDLIVLSTHGRSGLGRVLLGSVAEHVVRHAGCPVLTVRAKERAGRQESAA